jgi:hypothetical protein
MVIEAVELFADILLILQWLFIDIASRQRALHAAQRVQRTCKIDRLFLPLSGDKSLHLRNVRARL